MRTCDRCDSHEISTRYIELRLGEKSFNLCTNCGHEWVEYGGSITSSKEGVRVVHKHRSAKE